MGSHPVNGSRHKTYRLTASIRKWHWALAERV
jgi:hypothetical protein